MAHIQHNEISPNFGIRPVSSAAGLDVGNKKVKPIIQEDEAKWKQWQIMRSKRYSG